MSKFTVIVGVQHSMKMDIEAESEEAAQDAAVEAVQDTDMGLTADDVNVIECWEAS